MESGKGSAPIITHAVAAVLADQIILIPIILLISNLRLTEPLAALSSLRHVG